MMMVSMLRMCSLLLVLGLDDALQAVPTKPRPRLAVLRYEDDWVAVNKPAGMSVHRAEGTRRHDFVVSTLLKRQLRRKVYPVHRLDHRTSGALLFAFNPSTCAELSARLAAGAKTYVALTRGEWTCPELHEVARPVTVDGQPKEARTTFRLLATQQEPRASLVLALPETGRTHQIRKHAYAIGHPILGDSQHGDSVQNRWWRRHRYLNRLALHCLRLDLGDSLQVAAPLPVDLRTVLQRESNLWDTAVQSEPALLLDPFDTRHKPEKTLAS